jgi:hypothetical protein
VLFHCEVVVVDADHLVVDDVVEVEVVVVLVVMI